MKLIRFGAPGAERPGLILPDGRRIDASGFGSDYDEAFFGSDGLERLARWVARDGGKAPVVPDGVRLGPPLGRPSKIVCIGLNYRDHARETGVAAPGAPRMFLKCHYPRAPAGRRHSHRRAAGRGTGPPPAALPRGRRRSRAWHRRARLRAATGTRPCLTGGWPIRPS